MDPAAFCLACSAGRIYGWMTPRGLRRLYLASDDAPTLEVTPSPGANGVERAIQNGLSNYCSGVPERFAGIPLDLSDYSPFQRDVWEAARAIPWGETRTYGQVAAAIGRSKASRAVGQALGANPVPIVVPCHRVLAANARLGGFTGGLEWKRALLTIEGSPYRG